MIGKVADTTRLREVFVKTPVRAGLEGYEDWNCVFWVKEALILAVQDGKALGRNCCSDWEVVKDKALWYAKKKVDEHRFDGKGEYDQSKVPIWDALEEKEVVV